MTQGNDDLINQRLDMLSKRPFRAKFRLRGKERDIVLELSLIHI